MDPLASLWPLLLLLTWTNGALCYQRPTDGAHGPPPEYKARLQVLKLALALNEEWSPVWSEKLHTGAVAVLHPDEDFCTRLIPELEWHGAQAGTGDNKDAAKDEKDENEDEDDDQDDVVPNGPPVDTYSVIRKIVDYCAFSGMYVQYGLHLIGASMQCLFNRHARLHLSAISNMVDTPDEPFHEYLRGLVQDYQVVADKLSVVGTSLKNVVQLVTFVDDVDKKLVKLAGRKRLLEEFKLEVKEVVEKLDKRLDMEFDHACAVADDDWYDKDKKEVVSLMEFKIKKDKKKKKKKDKKDKKDKKEKKDKGDVEDGEKDEKKKKKKEKDVEEKEEATEGSTGAEGEKDKDEEKKKKKDKKDKGEDEEGDEKKDKKDKDKKEKKDKEKGKEKVIDRANELRMLMRSVFDRLIIREMPSTMWREIFEKNILVKPSVHVKPATPVVTPKKKAVEKLEFQL